MLKNTTKSNILFRIMPQLTSKEPPRTSLDLVNSSMHHMNITQTWWLSHTICYVNFLMRACLAPQVYPSSPIQLSLCLFIAFRYPKSKRVATFSNTKCNTYT